MSKMEIKYLEKLFFVRFYVFYIKNTTDFLLPVFAVNVIFEMVRAVSMP